MSLRPFEGVMPRCGERVYIDDAASVIGRVSLGDDVSVWPQAVIRGDVESIHIGERSNIQDGSVLHVTHYGNYGDGSALHIGTDVTVGHKVILHACTIHDSVLVGMGSIVLDQAVIEHHVLLGAGSLVPEGKILASGFLYFGNPVKQVRALTDKEIAFLDYSAQHYVTLKSRYCSP
jgi:carbonic anhydrase/acetyltransferase-like protein (isoleucine patch superfamily)